MRTVQFLPAALRDFRLRAGKWRVFFDLDTPGAIVVIGIDNRGQAY